MPNARRMNDLRANPGSATPIESYRVIPRNIMMGGLVMAHQRHTQARERGVDHAAGNRAFLLP